MKRFALAVLAAAAFFGVAPAAQSNVSPTADYCEYSLRGNGSHAPDADYSAWWNWYQNNRGATNLVETVGRLDQRVTDHHVRVRFKIRTNMIGYYEYAWFGCYWTPTSPAHGSGNTYFDINDSGFGPVLYP